MVDQYKPIDVLEFWNIEVGPKKWYKKFPAIDQSIRDRFLPTWEQARDGNLARWMKTAQGSLALIIVLDQFPRNMFRDTPDAFLTDPQALSCARTMIGMKQDMEINEPGRQFCYMPFMHVESLSEQEICVQLMTERLTSQSSLYHARKHRDVIQEFDRFPHRNEILNRPSTPEEITFLKSGGYTA